MCIETDAKNIIVPENGLYKSPQSLHNTYNLYETWWSGLSKLTWISAWFG